MFDVAIACRHETQKTADFSTQVTSPRELSDCQPWIGLAASRVSLFMKVCHRAHLLAY